VRATILLSTSLLASACNASMPVEQQALADRLHTVEAKCDLKPEISLRAVSDADVSIELAKPIKAEDETTQQKLNCAFAWAKENPDVRFGFTGNEVQD
jgi:hypothetical protein